MPDVVRHRRAFARSDPGRRLAGHARRRRNTAQTRRSGSRRQTGHGGWSVPICRGATASAMACLNSGAGLVSDLDMIPPLQILDTEHLIFPPGQTARPHFPVPDDHQRETSPASVSGSSVSSRAPLGDTSRTRQSIWSPLPSEMTAARSVELRSDCLRSDINQDPRKEGSFSVSPTRYDGLVNTPLNRAGKRPFNAMSASQKTLMFRKMRVPLRRSEPGLRKQPANGWRRLSSVSCIGRNRSLTQLRSRKLPAPKPQDTLRGGNSQSSIVLFQFQHSVLAESATGRARFHDRPKRIP